MSVATAPSFPFLPTKDQTKAIIKGKIAEPVAKRATKEKASIGVCKACKGEMKPFKDKAKGETEAVLTCVDCGYRKGDKVSKRKVATAPKSVIAQAKELKGTTPKRIAQKKTKIVKATSKGKATAPIIDKAKTLATAAKSAAKAIKKPRKGFSLTDEDIETYRAAWKEHKTIESVIPHNRGAYRAFILALVRLGKDKSHAFKEVKVSMREIMSEADTKDDDGKTAWQRYNGKEAHSEENALKIDGKLHQNAEVLQRLGGETPYGLRLLEIGLKVMKTKGMVIDVLKGKDDGRLYRLNTNSAAPVNAFRRQRTA